MKKLLLIVLVYAFSNVMAQTEVYLEINHLLNDQPFTFNTLATSPSGEEFSVNRLEYYLSEITLVHDGGQETVIPNFWMLINANTADSVYLGNFNVSVIESLKFGVGVNDSVNHLDPAQYPSNHPLAPKWPSMHWGWASGYRFLALEGKSGPNNQTFEIHSLGDNNYGFATIPLTVQTIGSELKIKLNAEYSELLANFSVNNNPIVHGESGIAKIALSNMANLVFTENTSSPNSVTEIISQSFSLYPNPGKDVINISSKKGNIAQAIRFYNVQGKLILNQQVPNTGRVQVSDLNTGIYFVTISNEEGVEEFHKLIISK